VLGTRLEISWREKEKGKGKVSGSKEEDNKEKEEKEESDEEEKKEETKEEKTLSDELNFDNVSEWNEEDVLNYARNVASS